MRNWLVSAMISIEIGRIRAHLFSAFQLLRGRTYLTRHQPPRFLDHDTYIVDSHIWHLTLESETYSFIPQNTQPQSPTS